MRKGELDLGARLKEIREQRGLTQRDLAKQGGVPHGIISMIERSEHGIFNVVGPGKPLGFAEMLGAVRGMTSSAVSLVWVPVPWLQEHVF